MASGVIYRLIKSGYSVIAIEKSQPSCVRRLVCFANAYYENEFSIGDVKSIKVDSVKEAWELSHKNIVPLLIDPDLKSMDNLKPDVLIDARMFKQKTDASIDLAKKVIGLGPGFTAGRDCHAVIETNRGKNLGEVIFDGAALEYTSIPTKVKGYTTERVLRSPADGIFRPNRKITDLINSRDIIGYVNDSKVLSQIGGIVRGLIYNNSQVLINQKIGDIDPRGDRKLCYEISDKASAVGYGVLKSLRHFNI